MLILDILVEDCSFGRLTALTMPIAQKFRLGDSGAPSCRPSRVCWSCDELQISSQAFVHWQVPSRCVLRVLSWKRTGMIGVLTGYVLLVSGNCVGQEPRPAAVGPTVSVSLGYVHLNTKVSTVGSFSENGAIAGINVDFNPRFGVKGEVGYTRTFGAFGISRSSDVLTFLAGPVFYPVRQRKFSIYAQGLAGAARIEGVLPEGGNSYLLSETIKPAWGLGAGVETGLSKSIGVRAGADYLRVSNLTPQLVLRGQWDPRVTVSLVYTFGKAR